MEEQKNRRSRRKTVALLLALAVNLLDLQVSAVTVPSK
jgi:hypothetical protein